MTKTKKRGWLGAIGKLERFYRAVVEGKRPRLFECPSCALSVNAYCRDCLWFLYEHKTCSGAGYRRSMRDIPWAEASLKRLAQWRARLEKE